MELKLIEIFIFFITLITTFYCYWTKKISKIAEKGLKFKYPTPYFGNNFEISFKSKHISLVVDEIYQNFPLEKYIGYFNFQRLNIVIKDPNLISEVTLKHFDNFADHFTFFDEECDPLFFYGIFQLKGERWRDMRTSLTPAFTSSKMKEMTPFIKECCKSLVIHLNNYLDKDGKIFETDSKELMTKFANDVIASCTFGIEINSFKEPNNEFFSMAKNLTQIKPWDFIRVTLIVLFPKLSHLLGIHVMKNEQSKYYRRIVKDIIKYREVTGLVRRDMMHLLMLAKNGKLQNNKNSTDSKECNDMTNFYEKIIENKGLKQNWKDDEITAQALNFVFAGFETLATLLGFILYELAINENCQQKLQYEVDEYIKLNGKDIEYVHIQKLKYLDMVISETLRLWPSVGILERLCTKEFLLPSVENNFKVKYHDSIMIPIYSLHRDGKYWENPLKFDPERFSDENKHKITSNTYLPFGNGPRNCIGSRFALIECKMIIFYLISNFTFVKTSKTEIPLVITHHPFSINTKNGIWIGLKRRN